MEALLQLGGQASIQDRNQGRLKDLDLLAEQIDIAPGGKRGDFKPLWKLPDHIQRAYPNGTGASENAQGFFGHNHLKQS
jgi:hypothetical protein